MPKPVRKYIETALFGGILLFLVYQSVRWAMIYCFPSYTVGVVKAPYKGAKGMYGIEYAYSVSNRAYTSSQRRNTFDKAKVEPMGNRYVVKYCSKVPRWSRMYMDRPVPDSIPDFKIWSDFPATGWGRLSNQREKTQEESR
ncbi:hypothetical protein G8759_07740 [Spirosoma aureum]|uniref:Uncharacterized protein n=1 Tax=Spirosoma aureum TaxID=2692134 RepID=A0A6G9AJ79_9BACT|nr:hypothetical protein [Spirosoma aureum]QIP12522.1 hypothetical protein G8759_07740 [Spirosoma aureum]